MSHSADGEWFSAQAVDGTALPLCAWQPPSPPRAVILLLPALGVPAQYYQPLAQALAGQGLAVLLLEQRGQGRSPLRASRQQSWGFAACLADIGCALEQAGARWPGCPRLLLGHSLGGHLAAMATALYPTQLAGVVLAACGSPWRRLYRGATRWQLELLARVLLPLSLRTLGYYPGHRIGFGGREAAGLMRDWSVLARENRYRAAGLDQDLEAGIRAWRGRMLLLRPADDALVPPAAAQSVAERFAAAQTVQITLSAAQIGAAADHYRWVREPQAAAAAIAAWWAGEGPT